jgi:hypothetical protein
VRLRWFPVVRFSTDFSKLDAGIKPIEALQLGFRRFSALLLPAFLHLDERPARTTRWLHASLISVILLPDQTLGWLREKKGIFVNIILIALNR